MGNKDTCLFYKSAAPVVGLNNIIPDKFDISDITQVNVANSSDSANSTLAFSDDQYEQMAKMVQDTAKKQTEQPAQNTTTKDSPEQNPALAQLEGLWKSKPESATSAVPDVNIDAVMGKDSGNIAPTKDGKGIHPGLIGGGVALAGGGLLIAYLEAQKAKRRRRKERERMRNMNSNIANV